MKRVLFLALSLLLLMLVGCTLPRNSVLLFDKPSPGKYENKVITVPHDWQNRMLIVSAEAVDPILGGAELHSHGIGHVHKSKSNEANKFDRPLGIENTVVGIQHVHNLISISTSPAESSHESARPLSYGLTAFLFDGLISYKMPAGLIVGYYGSDLPKGWNWCDGENKTPDLRGRFLSIAPPTGYYGESSHTHDTDHMHVWKAGENQDQPSFAGDITSPRQPISEFQERIHDHKVKEIGAETMVQDIVNEPQFIGIQFIQAQQGAKLPSGAIILRASNKTPFGWDLLSSRFDRPIEDRYIRALLNNDQDVLFGGEKFHSHKFTSNHSYELLSENNTGVVDSARNGPKIAIDDHGHLGVIDEEVNSSEAEYMPPFVKLTAIIKR